MSVRARAREHRRGFTTLLVLGVAAVGTLVVLSMQGSAFAQAAAGRDAVARTRARWAARGAIEAAIASLERSTLEPEFDDAFAALDDMAEVSEAAFEGATARILSSAGDHDVLGPVDAHSRINVNLMTRDDLLTLPYMTEDVADAILDWIDEDDDTRELGAEASYYLSREFPGLPRNATVRNVAELELVAGVLPEYVRGEDWNLNGVLDPNENDAEASFPDDNADGVLDAGWSGILTSLTTDGGLGASGEPLLDLATADPGEIQSRLGVDAEQADLLSTYAQGPGATFAMLIRTPLNQMRIDAGSGPIQAAALDDEQYRALLDEATIVSSEAGTGPAPGKLNLNTCEATTLEYLPGLDPAVADAIVFARESRVDGFASMADLLDVGSITRARLSQIYRFLGVRSNTYAITSRGRDEASGLEVEVVATIDRSTIPVTIREWRTR